MKIQRAIDYIKLYHRDINEEILFDMLNEGRWEFFKSTGEYRTTIKFSTVVNKRYYDLNQGISKIFTVYANDVKIPMLQGDIIIDDDEWGTPTNAVTTSSTSNDRYWYVSNSAKIGIVEKLPNAITRDEKTTNYQSPSSIYEVTIHYEGIPRTIGTASDRSAFLWNESGDSSANAFTPSDTAVRATINYAIKEIALIPGANQDLKLAQEFQSKFDKAVKESRKHVKNRSRSTGNIVQTHF